MSKWTVETTPKALKEIEALPDDLQSRYLHISKMLTELGPQRVRAPHVKYLRDKLWEMRLKGRDGIARAIYFAVAGRKLIVVRAFIKKTEKTPNREIELAIKRMEEL